MAKNLKVEIIGDASSYSKALGDASNTTNSFGSSLLKLGKYAAIGLGAAGVGGAVLTLKRGFDELKESQQVMAQTNAVIKSTGGAAEVTAKQVEGMATSLSLMSGADDEAIQAGENMLLTFTNVRNEAGKGNDIFNQATSTLTDFAFAMNRGAAPSAEQLSKNAILLGKALNDPVRGLTALRRVGARFTDDQQKQIEALVKSGKTMEAQKLILHELNKEFGGSAAAAGKTLPGQLNKLKNSFDELAGAVVGGLAPALSAGLGVLTKFFQKLQGAQGFKGKIVVAAQFVWSGLESAVGALRKQFSDLLFGSFSKGGGVGPEGIKFNEGLVSKIAGAFAALDWTEVGKSILDGIANALRTAGEFGKTFASSVVEGIRGVNWEEVGRVVGPGLATAITVAFTTLTDISFWAKNWDLALAVLIAAFPVGKIAGPIGKLLAKPFSDALLAITGVIERFSPRLAEAVLVSLRALPELVSSTLSRMLATAAALFGKLGKIAEFTLEVLGIEAALAAITQFVGRATGFFKDLGSTIAGAFDSAWEALKRGAIAAALAIVEPFSHLPGFLGGWARTAKDALQAELDKIDAARTVKKMHAEFDSQIATFRKTGGDYAAATAAGLDVLIANGRVIGQKAANAVAQAFAGKEAFAAGVALGNSLMTGVDAGIRSKINLVIGTANSVIAQINATMRSAAQAKSPSKLTALLGKDLVDGLSEGMVKQLNVLMRELGPAFTKTIVSVFTKLGTDAKTAGVKGLGNAAGAIVAAAKKAGVDARAALAVAMTEGGTSFGGKPGDSGTSFGPFQLHIGGANPFSDPGKARAFADSIQGITYALNQMAKAGAAGKTGFDAIRAIVTSFERPANPAAEIAKAIGYYKQIPETVGGALTAAGAKTSASIIATIQGLSALIKQYSPQIGKDHVTAVIQGIDASGGNLVAKARQGILAFIAAAKAQIVQSKKDLKDAFAGLATDALSAFDEAAQASFHNKSAERLAKMQLEDQINAATKGVADAQSAIDAAVAKLQADQGAGADAATLAEDQAAITAAVTQLGEAQRAATELQLQLNADQEQKAHDKQVEADKAAFTKRLSALDAFLQAHPEKYRQVQKDILQLLKSYIPGFNTAGYKLTHAFADGLNDGIAEVVAKARALANALEVIAGGKGGGGGGGAGGPQRPPDVPGGSRFATGGTVVNVTVQGDVTGEEVVRKVRDGLRTMGRNNALDPLAVRA